MSLASRDGCSGMWAAFTVASGEEKSIKSSHVPFELGLFGDGHACRNVSRDALLGTESVARRFGVRPLGCFLLSLCLRLVGRHPMILSWVKSHLWHRGVVRKRLHFATGCWLFRHKGQIRDLFTSLHFAMSLLLSNSAQSFNACAC